MNIIADELKLNNDDSALLLVNKIEELKLENSILYYNFPFYRGESNDEIVQAHVLLISKEFGVLTFRCLNDKASFSNSELKKFENLDSHVFAKINKQDRLRSGRRSLKIKVSPKVFIASEPDAYDDTFIGVNQIKKIIYENKSTVLNQEEYNLLIATIEGSINLKSKKDREVESSGKLTKGKILTLIQNKEAVFDIEQKRAALNIIDSPQRIRGLAGSGKTIILAMKAAIYHLQNPDALILYTYFTKALYGQVKYLIEKYYRDFSDNIEPDWNKIDIYHGWGGTGLTGVYSETAFENGIPTISFQTARIGNRNDPFDFVCTDLEKKELKQKYDLTLIDEGQDFPKSFYKVCRKITKNNRIVWAYDDFQNIFDVDIQDEKETFGKDSSGNYIVDFNQNENKLQDIILFKCYRNPRFALITAFSLGLGIYNDKVLQRLENNKHWEDLGFKVEGGDSSDKSKMVISRPVENSPIETNEYYKEDSIQVHVFERLLDEAQFVAENIIIDIRQEKLRPDDICVISLDQNNIKGYFNVISRILIENKIKVFNLLTAPSNNTSFSVDNHVTLSTINKAKGNEMGMVYIVGVDSIFNNKDYVIDRNKLFTAITRSKGWVTITGVKAAILCKNEIDILKKNAYKLNFTQPSKAETRTILRGMTTQQTYLNDLRKKMESISKSTGLSMEEILQMLSSQNINKK